MASMTVMRSSAVPKVARSTSSNRTARPARVALRRPDVRMFADLGDKAKEAGNRMGEAADEAKHRGQETARNVGNKADETASSGKSEGKGLMDKAEEQAGKAADAVKGAAGKAKDKAGELKDKATS